MLFGDIQGNINIKEQLIRSVKNNRIAHAQLFVGNEGNAKLSLALAYAQYINCKQRSKNDSCNKCHSCLMYNTLSHPDLHLIFPVLKINNIKNPISDNFIQEWKEIVIENPYLSISNWYQKLGSENKQGLIYVNEAEKIQHKIALKNHESEYRIILIWMPEKMNLDTANKLLKLFEEPSEGTVFLMITENQEELLPTILSRMQRIKIRKFNNQEVCNYLKEKMLIEEEFAQQIAKSVNGNINLAIQKTQEKEDVLLKEFQKWMQICYMFNLRDLAEWTEEFAKKGRENQKLFLNYSLKIIRKAFLMNFSNEKLSKSEREDIKFIKNFSLFIHEHNSIDIFKKIDNTIKNISRNSNPKIIFYELSLQLNHLLKVKRKFVQ